jgi:2'-5' RNA ligase
MRAFIACNLDVESVRRIEEVAAALRAHPLAPKARWVPPTKMHVTLKFFGDIDLGLAPAIRDALATLASTWSGSHLRAGVDALSAFPSPQHARVVVVLLSDPDGGLVRLADRVEDAMSPLGFERDARELRPHVTLARPASATNADAWLQAVTLPSEPAKVTELVLYRSDFGTPQNEYAALARFSMPG